MVAPVLVPAHWPPPRPVEPPVRLLVGVLSWGFVAFGPTSSSPIVRFLTAGDSLTLVRSENGRAVVRTADKHMWRVPAGFLDMK